MMELLSTFAALSMAGTVVLSVLPQGGMKRTAGMVVGLLTLMCWVEGIAGLIGLDALFTVPVTALAPTSVSVEDAARTAEAVLESMWEGTP